MKYLNRTEREVLKLVKEARSKGLDWLQSAVEDGALSQALKGPIYVDKDLVKEANVENKRAKKATKARRRGSLLKRTR